MKMMNVSKKAILLVLLGVVVLVCICGIGISTLFFLLPQPNDNYAVIFDAQASETRMYIYKYNGNYGRVDDLSIQQVSSCQTNDTGISTIQNMSTASFFSGCLQLAEQTVPETKKNTTPIVLKGTDGMRLLGVSSPNMTSYIYEGISALLDQSQFQLRNDSLPATLSGTEQAVYAWISTNYALNTLTKIQSNAVGIVDLGDNSAQISFSVQPSMNNTNQSSSNLNLFGSGFNSYSDSFMCFGQSQSMLMYFSRLLNTSDAQGNVATPCLPSGYNMSLTSSTFTASPCTNGLIFNTTTTTSASPSTSYTFYGASNYSRCASQIEQLLFSFPFCLSGENDCSQSLPNTSATRFIGLSNIWTNRNLRNSIISRSINVTNSSSTEYLCSLNSSQMTSLNLSISQDQLAKVCFSSVYIDQMIDLLGIDTIDPQRSVNGLDLVWPLGYLVDQLSRGNYKQERPDESRAMPYFAYVITVVMLGLIILIVVFLFVYYVCVDRKRRSGSKDPPGEPAIVLELLHLCATKTTTQ